MLDLPDQGFRVPAGSTKPLYLSHPLGGRVQGLCLELADLRVR